MSICLSYFSLHLSECLYIMHVYSQRLPKFNFTFSQIRSHKNFKLYVNKIVVSFVTGKWFLSLTDFKRKLFLSDVCLSFIKFSTLELKRMDWFWSNFKLRHYSENISICLNCFVVLSFLCCIVICLLYVVYVVWWVKKYQCLVFVDTGFDVHLSPKKKFNIDLSLCSALQPKRLERF